MPEIRGIRVKKKKKKRTREIYKFEAWLGKARLKLLRDICYSKHHGNSYHVL